MLLDDLLKEPFVYPPREAVDGFVDQAMACLPASRKDLLSRVSHSIRTPLAAILGFKEVLDMDINVSPEDRQRYEAILQAEAVRLRRFIETLNVFRQLLSGQLPLQRKSADIRQTVTRAVERCRIDATAKDIRIEVVSMGNEVLLQADHERIGLAIEHLLLNALRATPREGLIDIELIDAPDRVTLIVEDSGYGIHPDEVERLFKPFQRIRRPDDTGGELGLGLSVVRAIVEMHQGTVLVESSPMSGARLILTFPR